MTETTAAPAPAEAKPNRGLSQADAVAQMRANRASAAAPTPPQPAPEPAAETSNPEPGETVEANGVEAEQAQPEGIDEQPTEGEAEPTAEQDDGQTIVQLKDGSTVPLEELVAGYMKDGDYRKKTSALSEDRKALAAERQALEAERRTVSDKARELDTTLQQEIAAARAERERYAASVAEVEKALNQQGAEWAHIDWEVEAQRDPNWQLKFARFQKWQHAMEVTRSERDGLDAKAKADAEAARQAAQAEAAKSWQGQRQALEQHIAARHADLLDPEKGKQEFRLMAATAEAAGIPGQVLLAALGYGQQEGVPIMAAPVFELLRKATRYDQIVSQQTKALASGTAPKPDPTGKLKVVKAGAARFRPPSPTDAAVGRAQAAFNADRSMANAVALNRAKREARAAKAR